MIWLFVGATVAAVWLFLVILYVTGDLKRIRCGHHNTETEWAWSAAAGYWVEAYWKCHSCGKTKGQPQ